MWKNLWCLCFQTPTLTASEQRVSVRRGEYVIHEVKHTTCSQMLTQQGGCVSGHRAKRPIYIWLPAPGCSCTFLFHFVMTVHMTECAAPRRLYTARLKISAGVPWKQSSVSTFLWATHFCVSWYVITGFVSWHTVCTCVLKLRWVNCGSKTVLQLAILAQIFGLFLALCGQDVPSSLIKTCASHHKQKSLPFNKIQTVPCLFLQG